MKILELAITLIFAALIIRLFLQSQNTSSVIGSLFKGSTDIIGAVVPATL